MSKKPRFLTGITATGELTLGHYLGVIKNIIKIQEEYEIIIMIGDLHALTTPKKNINYLQNCKKIASLLYSCGIKKEAKIFIQSQIKEHLEIMNFLSPHVNVGRLLNMIQYKEKKKNEETGNLSLLSYPVLMASDIFLYDADLVIVGKDQSQHLELASEIQKKFNHFYGEEILKLPRMIIPEIGSKIMGLKNPEKKMSKSGDDFISLLESKKDLRRKIMSAKTDSENKIYFSEEKIGISNLLTMYSLLSKKTIEELEKDFLETNYHQFKDKLINIVEKELDEISLNYKKNLDEIDFILEKNKNYLKEIAEKKTEEIKKKINLI
jgi:tryptophanyl-tRNA synthetase